MSKYCKYCDSYKELNEFHKQKSSKDGRQAMCKPCRKHSNKTNPTQVNRGAWGVQYKKKYPVPEKIIYGIVDSDNNVVYIGESKRGPFRLYCHLETNKEMTSLSEYDRTGWSYVVLWDGTNHSKQDRLMLESVLIHSLRPKYNKQWNQDD